jgi:peptidoglycan/LPS O-acetylase OafA/YrhL
LLTRTAEAAPARSSAGELRPHVRSLDGLRFLAALCVAIAHGYGYIVTTGATTAPSELELMILTLAAPGMTLFFVLSGFVIHLNYRDSVGDGGQRGTFNFFVARFARLYPLFLAVFAFEIGRLLWWRAPQHGFDVLTGVSFFLTFTQTWFVIPVQGHALFDHYATFSGLAQATGTMWSLSIEALFYVAYPWLARPLGRLRARRLAAVFAVVAVVNLSYFALAATHAGEIQKLGLAIYGTHDLAMGFLAWMTFYSPIGRITEFVLGALAAQHLCARTKAPWDRHAGFCSVLVAAALVLWYVLALRNRISGTLVFSGALTAALILLPWSGAAKRATRSTFCTGT